jgi:hypothetical protein
MALPARERQRLPLRRLALLCAALVSCTTVRTPVSTIEPAVTLRDGAPEPQLELWVESNRSLTPVEQERYRSEARAALENALAGRALAGDEGQLVVIRAQGVTRTSGRRSDQTAATVGIVVGAVVIIAAVVVAIVVGGKDHGGGGHVPHGRPSASAPRVGSSAGRAAGARAWHAPRFAPVPAPRIARGFPVAPAPRRPGLLAPGRPFVPAPGAGFAPVPRPWPGPSVDIEVGLWWTLPFTEPPETTVYDLPPAPVEPGTPWEEEYGAPAAPEPRLDQLAMPPPDGYPVDDRGFFDGDRLVLEAVVVDRENGEAVWTKSVSRKADPRDARAVQEAVDALLSEEGWQPPAAE